MQKAPQRGVTEVRGGAVRRDPRVEQSVPPAHAERSTGVRPAERLPETDPAPPSERSEVVAKAPPAPDTAAVDARFARLEANLDATKAELETVRAELCKAHETIQTLASKMDAERAERVAATERVQSQVDTTLALARERMQSAADRESDAAPSRPALAPEMVAKEKAKPKFVDLPRIQVPEAAPSGGGSLKSMILKALLLSAVGGGVVAAERKEIAKTAHTLIDMPKEAGTKASMASILTIVQADFVNEPLPAPEEFSAYLKSRAVANQDKAAIDGWGREYRLDVNPSALRSAGSDGKFDTADDLVLEIEAKKNDSFH